MKAKGEKENKRFPGMFDIDAMRAATTIGEFDDLYIAKIYGFSDKTHYYRSCGAKWWLNRIRVPAIAINAKDDPFIEVTSLPTETDVGPEAPVRLIYHDYGGHCGFYTQQKYMDHEIDDKLKKAFVPSHGWLAEEMARSVEHIHNSDYSSQAIN